ncbi:GNAT family N-acetyltransferase [Lysobacter sp. CA196]|uniref:GNAT family N-acetyltransferase n=1 Tax=Lysobacter sp. CA196 TaxID=3455606 RepID=UPI003F8D32C2
MNPLPELRVVDHDDIAWHGAYCDYVSLVFRQADFRRWCEWRQWGEDYRAFCIVGYDGRVLANASVSRMRLRVEGREVVGYQLGAVGCLPQTRGQGLARRAMQAALGYCGSTPVFLFANDSVLDFYPRFGFAAAPQSLFEASLQAEPAGDGRGATLDLSDDDTRADFLRLAAAASAVSERFAACDYGRIATWYAANGYASPLIRLDHDTWVFAEVEDGVLTIEDVFATRPFDLSAALPHLIGQPIHTVRFGFTPERLWPQARAVGAEADADLFVRNLVLPAGPHRFPLLART